MGIVARAMDKKERWYDSVYINLRDIAVEDKFLTATARFYESKQARDDDYDSPLFILRIGGPQHAADGTTDIERAYEILKEIHSKFIDEQ